MRIPKSSSSPQLLSAGFTFAHTAAQTGKPGSDSARSDNRQSRNPNSPANIGRTELTNYLDDIAAKELATRRATVAEIKTRAEAEARQREVRTKILTLIGGLP